MAIRPTKMRTSKEEYKELNDLINKSKGAGKYRMFSLSSGIGIALLVTTTFTVFYKFIYTKLFIKKNTNNEIDEYFKLAYKHEAKESDWMTKSVFKNEIKSNNKL